MSVARTWVFPIIRMVLVAVVAAALVKLAFFPDGPAASDPAMPTGKITEPQIPVSVGTVTNDVTVPAAVTADPAVPARATAAGTINKISATKGAVVAAGDTLFDIKVETVREPVESKDAAGNVTVTERKPLITFVAVTAPAAGTVSSLSVISGQTVAIGDVSAQVAPASFSVSGALNAQQRYRLTNQPTDAVVAIANGPAPFTCTNLAISSPLAGAETDNSDPANSAGGGAAPASSETKISCAVPADILVFSGLSAEMTIAGGKAENVLVLPTTAVRGTAQTGVVWFVTENGKPEERPVTLGLTDGKQVEVTSGVADKDIVLEFVPGAEAATPDGCTDNPDGSVTCSEGIGG